MMGALNLRRIRVWDLPVRLFHWILVLLMVMLFATAYAGRMDAHAAIGRIVLVLVLFRLVWGVVGSRTAKFRDFVRSPESIRAYLSGKAPHTLGHNPLGGVMIVALLATLLLQALSGMFSSNGIDFDGPFAHWIGSVASELVTRGHVLLAYAIAALAVTHVLAVLVHWVRHNDNLIAPMITGDKWVAPNTPQPSLQSPVVAVMIVVLLAAVVAAATRFA